MSAEKAAVPRHFSIYGNWTRGGMRSLPAAEAVAFIEEQGEDRLSVILGRMRAGYLGRESLTLDELRAVASAMTDQCGEQFAQHPTMPHLIAICTRPRDHEGDHNNVLPKHAGDPGAPRPCLRAVKP